MKAQRVVSKKPIVANPSILLSNHGFHTNGFQSRCKGGRTIQVLFST